jgi:hypothetical protein
MKSFLLIVLLAANALAAERTYIGWISDSGCALARASAGKFTATNPDCARRCIKQGKSVVLISQDLKTVFAIENPDVLKSQIGNKVRVSASSVGEHSLHVNEVTFLEESNPECERPALKQ